MTDAINKMRAMVDRLADPRDMSRALSFSGLAEWRGDQMKEGAEVLASAIDEIERLTAERDAALAGAVKALTEAKT